MRALRFFAIILIFGVATVAWSLLGGAVTYRTERLDNQLSQEMTSLWGPRILAQAAPYWISGQAQAERANGKAPAASDVHADVKHVHRYKGLLWYSTFTVDFQARYTLAASEGKEAGVFVFPLPADVTGYDGLEVQIDGSAREVTDAEIARGRIVLPVPLDREHVITVKYVTRGREVWLYTPGEARIASGRNWDRHEDVLATQDLLSSLKNFSLTVTTNFSDIDYPKGTVSPNLPADDTNGGRAAVWKYDTALTNKAMGVVMPQKINAGPIAARMSFFAPVSLLFFFTVLFAVVVVKRISLHPMHYLFLSAAFFAFHILLAYLVDHVNVHGAFWICAAVSVLLVVSYMRLVAGMKFAVLYAGGATLVYLVGFAYAFFWTGMTGLTVTIAAVLTLFAVMQATGRVNWFEVFKRPPAQAPPPMP